jgi:type IX secretion system PorP/SprF family membrane protein
MNKALRIIAVFIVCLPLCKSTLQGQDASFSQYYAAPLMLNPSLTGLFDGNYRLQGIYRDQWRGSQLNPMKTFTTGVDVRFDLQNQFGKYKDAVGVGVNFVRDLAGPFQLSTTGMFLHGAFHKSLKNNEPKYLSGGFSFGVMQRGVNVASLDFQDSFNGINAFDRATLENLPANNFTFLDYSLGLNYTYSPKKALGYSIGVSAAHLDRPEQSFYRRGGNFTENELSLIPNSNLPIRYAIHGHLLIPVNGIEWSPRINFMQQGKSLLGQAGLNIRIPMDKDNTKAIHWGGWLRAANKLEGMGISDLGLLLGYQIDTFLLGLSYDYNLLKISSFKTPGTFELSITYFGTYDNNTGLCPVF